MMDIPKLVDNGDSTQKQVGCLAELGKVESKLVPAVKRRDKHARTIQAGTVRFTDLPDEEIPIRKTKTLTSFFGDDRGNAQGRETILLRPNFVFELQHEKVKLEMALEQAKAALDEVHSRTENSTAIDKQDASPTSVEDAFGHNGSWTCFAALPKKQYALTFLSDYEKPFAVREWKTKPHDLSSSNLKSMLREWCVGAVCSKGIKNKGDVTLGQDNSSISKLTNGWEVLSVFDGHGAEGHWPSARAARTCPFFLQSSACREMLQDDKAEEALTHAFQLIQNDLIVNAAKEKVDLMFSGCTAAVALRHPKQDWVWVATAGDSRAILVHPERGVVGETSDHHPATREDEAQRITDSGGEVISLEYQDGYVSHRVFVKDRKFPGLCMTRSLGDLVVKDSGVICEPEVVKWPLSGNEGSYLVVCTDGVWEFLTSREVAEIVMKGMASGVKGWAQSVALELLHTSKAQWRLHEGNHYCDDISIILAPLTGNAAPECEQLNLSSADLCASRQRETACEVCATQ